MSTLRSCRSLTLGVPFSARKALMCSNAVNRSRTIGKLCSALGDRTGTVAAFPPLIHNRRECVNCTGAHMRGNRDLHVLVQDALWKS